MSITMTRHAEARAQQRSIPPFVMSLLIEHGTNLRQGAADICFLDKEARRRIKRELGERIHAAIEPYLDAYVVCSDDGAVITASWRTQRFKRR